MDLIANQHVYSQKDPFFSSKKASCRQTNKRSPAGPAWWIKQRPAYVSRPFLRNFSLTAGLESFFNRFKDSFKLRDDAPNLPPAKKLSQGETAKTGGNQAGFYKRPEKPAGTEKPHRTAGLPETLHKVLKSLPLPAFLIIALSFLVSFAVLDWESPSLAMLFQGPGFPESGILEPLEDSRSQQRLASYVGAAISSSWEGEEEIPLDLMESFSWGTYTVRRGDTVSGIAADHHLSMDAIIASNGIANVKRLREGESLRLPNMDGIPYTVKKGDSISKISAAMGVPKEAILDANDIQNDAIAQGAVLFIPGARMKREELKMAMGDLFIYPIRGRLTSPFGWRNDPISGVRRHHSAVDLAAPTGTPIRAAQDGRVSVVGSNPTYGLFVILEHGAGYQTMYAHMNVISVKQGVYVIQGSRIGDVGSTGYSTGPHLHFAVYKNGRPVNPLEFLNQ
jgi:murein DD-endopeptidase MepM/ murein hydrolase activator NlpD